MPIHSFHEIIINIERTDVTLRLVFLGFVIILPIVNIFILFLKMPNQKLHHLTIGTCVYMFFYLTTMATFGCGMFHINQFLQFFMDFLSNIFALCFTILYFRNDNPMAVNRHTIKSEISELSNQIPLVNPKITEKNVVAGKVENTEVLDIVQSIKSLMDKEKPFVNEDYSLEQLTASLHITRSIAIQAIHEMGFSSFKDYMSFLRIQYFKLLAQSNPNELVANLMLKAGYSSRATFYRHFSTYEQCTPKEYIENVRRA